MIKDKARKIDLKINPFKNLKGHTRIELTDVRTGEKKVIEHDNNFQPGVLANYLRGLGAFNNSPFDNDTWAGYAEWRNLVGGIMLFTDSIDDSQDEVEYMPDGNVMIANASYGVTNSGVPSELGSWNEAESVIANDSVTLVFDWNTSQGNGTISAVCLTSELGGYIGYGNASGDSASNKKSIYQNQNSRSPQGLVFNNKRYRVTDDGIAVSKICVTQGSVFDGIEKTISHSWGDYREIVYDGAAGKIVIADFFIRNSWGTGATLTLDVFDATTETFSNVTITNTSGKALGLRGMSCANGVFYCAEYVDGYSNKNPLHGFKLSDGSYIGASVTSGTVSSPFMGKITDEILMCGEYSGGIYIQTDSTDPTSWKPTNGKMDFASSTGHQSFCHSSDVDALIWNNGNYGSSSGLTRMWKNPLYLATVNNLESAITKDSTQTMKVIYTLSENNNG